MAKVQIEKDLFMALCRYHLAGDRSETEAIQKALSTKIDTLAAHERYSQRPCHRGIQANKEEV